MNVFVGHRHSFAADQGSRDLYLGPCLKSFAKVFTRSASLIQILDLLNYNRPISEGHLSLDRYGLVTDEKLVVRFPVDYYPIDIAELTGIIGLRHGPPAIHQPAEQTHDTALPHAAAR